MTQPKISFYSFATYVIDMDESKLFYKRLGYKEGNIDETDDYMLIEMEPPGGDGVLIELRQSHAYGENAGRTVTVFTLDVEAGIEREQALRAQSKIVEDLLFRGFNFINMTPGEFYVNPFGEGTIEMVDPQGARIEFLIHD